MARHGGVEEEEEEGTTPMQYTQENISGDILQSLSWKAPCAEKSLFKLTCNKLQNGRNSLSAQLHQHVVVVDDALLLPHFFISFHFFRATAELIICVLKASAMSGLCLTWGTLLPGLCRCRCRGRCGGGNHRELKAGQGQRSKKTFSQPSQLAQGLAAGVLLFTQQERNSLWTSVAISI